MKYGRTYNFSAGPATMPEPVLEEVRDEMMNYKGSGMCVMEMSHRSKVFQQIIDEAEQDLRDLMNIPDNYKVLFIQGGATLQFSMIPMNLMKNGKAVYIETGAWSKKAIAEAKKVGEVIVAASSRDDFECFLGRDLLAVGGLGVSVSAALGVDRLVVEIARAALLDLPPLIGAVAIELDPIGSGLVVVFDYHAPSPPVISG